VHPTGRPHTRPVLAVWTDGVLFTTSSRAAQKGRNLHLDPRCSVAIMDDDMHIVVEGTAAPVEGGPSLDRVAEAYRSKYDWPVTVVEGGLEAPYAGCWACPVRAVPDNTDSCLRPRHRRADGAPPHPLAVRVSERPYLQAVGVPAPPRPVGGPSVRAPSRGWC